MGETRSLAGKVGVRISLRVTSFWGGLFDRKPPSIVQG